MKKKLKNFQEQAIFYLVPKFKFPELQINHQFQ